MALVASELVMSWICYSYEMQFLFAVYTVVSTYTFRQEGKKKRKKAVGAMCNRNAELSFVKCAGAWFSSCTHYSQCAC